MSGVNRGPIAKLPAVTARELDGIARCPCGCGEALLQPRCHPGAGAKVVYDPTERVLVLLCAICFGLMLKVRIDRGSEGPPAAAHGGAHAWGCESLN